MGSIFEHSEDTFWGGVLKEAVSQNEATPEVMRLEFSLCVAVI